MDAVSVGDEAAAVRTLNASSAAAPIRFSVDGIYVWARTRIHAAQILDEAEAADSPRLAQIHRSLNPDEEAVAS